jgi:hypothetical protein
VSVDDLVPAWTEAEVASLDTWRQGLLVPLDEVAWLDNAGSGVVGQVAHVSETGYMALNSQTCDIVLSSPGNRHPFVQVSPVRDLAVFNKDKIDAIKRGDVVEYVYLSDPPVVGAEWGVDLRVSVPISKRILALARPIPGFANEREELDFAERVAAKLSRPALHDAITTGTLPRLRAMIARSKKSERWCDDVEQFRLEVNDGSRLEPKRVRLLVLTDVKLDAAEARPLREFWKSEKKQLTRAKISTDPIGFRVVSKMELKEYRIAIPMDIPDLGRGFFL